MPELLTPFIIANVFSVLLAMFAAYLLAAKEFILAVAAIVVMLICIAVSVDIVISIPEPKARDDPKELKCESVMVVPCGNQ